jgi:DNA (cytosine-5)-methyltransferase 1
LQTFPQSYQLIGTLTSKARQVGNAVPPLLSEALGKHILELSRTGAFASKGKK